MVILQLNLAFSEQGKYNIISCRHFDDILFRHGGTRKPGVLLIYNSDRHKAMLQSSLLDAGAGNMYVLFFKVSTYDSSYTLNRILNPSGISLDARFKCNRVPCLYSFPINATNDEDFQLIKGRATKKKWSTKLDSVATIPVEFTNNHWNVVKLYWEGTERGEVGSLKPGESMVINSYTTHIFSADEVSTGKTVGKWFAGESKIMIKSLSTDGYDDQCHADGNCGKNMADQYVGDENFNTRVDNTLSMMYHINTYQPPTVTKRYTTKGYAKKKMPKKMFNKLLDFYKSSTYPRAEEPIADLRPYLNVADVPTTMVDVSSYWKDRLYRWGAKVLAKWVGIDPSDLEPTYCYGIRIYHTGAMLRRHIDIVSTHVLSIIVQVDQNVKESWPLTVITPGSDKEVNITLQSRDIVLYESSNVLHGRPYPLNGDYANVFVHFKPKKKWNYEYFMSQNGYRIQGAYED